VELLNMPVSTSAILDIVKFVMSFLIRSLIDILMMDSPSNEDKRRVVVGSVNTTEI
jgi:hypothetical protein